MREISYVLVTYRLRHFDRRDIEGPRKRLAYAHRRSIDGISVMVIARLVRLVVKHEGTRLILKHAGRSNRVRLGRQPRVDRGSIHKRLKYTA